MYCIVLPLVILFTVQLKLKGKEIQKATLLSTVSVPQSLMKKWQDSYDHIVNLIIQICFLPSKDLRSTLQKVR